MKKPESVLIIAVLSLVSHLVVAADHPPRILFENVRIFDGVAPELKRGSVLVEGNTIARIAATPSLEGPEGTTIIDGEGRILSPGFIDVHAHVNLQVPKDQLLADTSVFGARAGEAARYYLEHGFTSVRDAGGTHPDFAHAIDSGLIAGPRIFPSGAIISQTGGHGDFRPRNAPHHTLGCCGGDARADNGLSVIVDGEALTLAAVRENLRLGATQIKIMGGGGVASDYDPLHSLQPSPAEIRAAVQAASDWGTYVMAHSYTAPAIRRLVENGVKSIEHGHLIDDETARLCADEGVVISTQVSLFHRVGELPGMNDKNRAKLKEVLEGMDRLMELIRKYGITTGFGTDFAFGSYPLLGTEFTARSAYFTPAQIMKQATSESAEILRMSGRINPYGRFGEIREGWLADLVLIDGEPFEDISVLEHLDRAVVLVMKDGEVVADRR